MCSNRIKLVTMKRNVFNFLVLMFFFLGIPLVLTAQQIKTPLFKSHDVLHMKLKSNYNKVLDDVGDHKSKHKAKIKYTDPNGKKQKIRIKIETRGNFRSNPYNCDFPPIKLYFKDYSKIGNTIFEGQEELKLVTHCQQEISGYVRHVYREYLLYRIYNMLTPYSFQVRLFNINYKPRFGIRNNIKPGFFIEDNDMLAARFGGEELDRDDNYLPVDSTYYALVSFFEYMIGNTDWSVEMLQNIEVIQTVKGKNIPVPYDFDVSACVCPPYAPRALNVNSTTFMKRKYNGPKFSKAIVSKVFKIFSEKKQDILYLINESILLNTQEKKRFTDYIGAFYREMENAESDAIWLK